MKKILLFIFLSLCFIGKVNAQDITLEKFVNVVNNGDVTKSFIKSLPKKSTGSIKASLVNDDQIYLECSFDIVEYDEDKNLSYNYERFGITLTRDSELNILKGEKTYDKKTEEYISPYYIEVLKIVPYWTVEASSKYETIKGYLGSDDVVKTFAKIFDRCYYEKMGVCYTEITKFTLITHMTKVELTDKSADYAIDYFKQVERENDDKEFENMLFKILIGLVIAIIVVSLLRGIILSVTKQ